MLGGSEFRLRRGFASGKTLVRRRRAAGQKAGLPVLLPLLLLSKSNPLRWASIWFWVQTYRLRIYTAVLFPKRKTSAKADVFLLGFRRPKGGSTLW